MDSEVNKNEVGINEEAVQTTDTAEVNGATEGATESGSEKVAERATSSESDMGVKPETLRTFTQDEVNEIIRERLSRYDRKVAEEIGGSLEDTKSKLEALVKLQSDYDTLKASYDELYRERTFDQFGIDPERSGDIDAIMKSKNMDFTAHNLEQLLSTHPEWRKQTTAFQQVGAPRGDANPQGESEREKASRLFGLNGFVSHK